LNTNRERFEESSLFKRNVIRHPEDEIRRMFYEPGEGSIHRRRREKDNVRTQIIKAPTAVSAGAAWNSRFNGDPVTFFYRGHSRAHGGHNPGGFVA